MLGYSLSLVLRRGGAGFAGAGKVKERRAALSGGMRAGFACIEHPPPPDAHRHTHPLTSSSCSQAASQAGGLQSGSPCQPKVRDLAAALPGQQDVGGLCGSARRVAAAQRKGQAGGAGSNSQCVWVPYTGSLGLGSEGTGDRSSRACRKRHPVAAHNTLAWTGFVGRSAAAAGRPEGDTPDGFTARRGGGAHDQARARPAHCATPPPSPHPHAHAHVLSTSAPHPACGRVA